MIMNWPGYLISGFVATIALTTLLAVFRGGGMTRMDFSLMLGTIFTYNRDRAKVIGFTLHFLLGWLFSLVYVLIFIQLGTQASFRLLGPMLGLVHALFLLSVGMWILPSVHPRMASEDQGPEPTRQLEPPGYLAMNYGRQTPLAMVLAHVVYGAIIGWMYH